MSSHRHRTAHQVYSARVPDYPNLWDYARGLYHEPGIAETVAFGIYRRGYHSQSELRNPLGIVPKGPAVDWSAPGGVRFERSPL